jgi:coenzyme F420-reducing hydrogenase alpha subunit
VHFFALAGPDLLLGLDADPADRNIVALLKTAPDVARNALRLRTIGQQVTELVGGRGTHPVASVAGGLAAPLDAGRVETLRKLAAEALPLGAQLVEVARDALLANEDLIRSLPIESHYLGTVSDGCLDLYEGDLRLRAPDGTDTEFSEDEWASYMHEETVPTSFAKHVFCKTAGGTEVPFRVGALARLNCADSIDTPLAQAELERFRELGGNPCHETVMYHYARLVELLYAAEKLAEIVADDEIMSDQVRAEPSGSPRHATAHVEAPRGVLIHDYEVDSEGIVTKVNLIVATQQNMALINETIAMSASQYLDQPDDLLLNGIEFGIRCYDPCLSCATHRLGDMKMEVVIRQRGDVVRTVRR